MALPLEDFKVGNIYKSNTFGDMEVIENNGSRDVTVRFLNTGSVVKNLQRGNVIRGAAVDFMAPSVLGIGIVGTQEEVSKTVAYKYWAGMITRCYSEDYHKTRETYRGCSVAKEWHYFPNFRKWFNDNYVDGYHLDKDLLNQGNKVYSPETCCFIPPEVNSYIVERGSIRDGCEMGVSKRRKKGSMKYNGIYNVVSVGVYLLRTTDLELANSRYKEFKKLVFEEIADKYESLGKLTSAQAECLRTRKV